MTTLTKEMQRALVFIERTGRCGAIALHDYCVTRSTQRALLRRGLITRLPYLNVDTELTEKGKAVLHES